MNKINDDIEKIFNSRSFAPQTFAEMKEACSAQIIKLGCSAFEYAKVHDDGTAIILYSDPAIAKYVVSKQESISAHVPAEIINTEFWFIPTPNGPYSECIKGIKEISNSGSFANYIRRHPGFYEMCSFWILDDENAAFNKFINMKESLEQYYLRFIDQTKNLISAVERDRFKLTENMLPNFKGLDSKNPIYDVNLLFHIKKFNKN